MRKLCRPSAFAALSVRIPMTSVRRTRAYCAVKAPSGSTAAEVKVAKVAEVGPNRQNIILKLPLVAGCTTR